MPKMDWRQELADALQVASLLATQLAGDAIKLEAALDRAVRALRRQAEK